MAHAEASARTVEAAVTAAAAQLGLRSDQVDVEVLEDPVPSTFGYIGAPARVRVTPRPTPSSPPAPPAAPSASRTPATLGSSDAKQANDPNGADLGTVVTDAGSGVPGAAAPSRSEAGQASNPPGPGQTSNQAAAAYPSATDLPPQAPAVPPRPGEVSDPGRQGLATPAPIDTETAGERTATPAPEAGGDEAPRAGAPGPAGSVGPAAPAGPAGPGGPAGEPTPTVGTPQTAPAATAPASTAPPGSGPNGEQRLAAEGLADSRPAEAPPSEPGEANRPSRRTYHDESIDPGMVEADTERAGDFLEGLLDALDVDGDLTTWVDEVGGHIDLEGTDLNMLVGANGETLDALQELTRLAVLRQSRRRVRLLLDINGFRARHREQLIAIVKTTVEQVIRTREPHEFQPMTPAERKIVHDAVASMDGAQTESLGEEPHRRVVVRPT